MMKQTNSESTTALRLDLTKVARYGSCHAWLIFLSALDILGTSTVLAFGGAEVNPMADWVLARWGLVGLVVYKYALIAFVVWACETIGRQRDAAGRRLAEWSVALTVIPVYLAFTQWLTAHA